jgi:hypothetical protein
VDDIEETRDLLHLVDDDPGRGRRRGSEASLELPGIPREEVFLSRIEEVDEDGLIGPEDGPDEGRLARSARAEEEVAA